MLSKKPAEKSELDKLIDELTSHLRTLDATADSDEFNDVQKKLSKLHKLRKATPSQPRVSPDTIAVVAGNILTTLVVVKYERMHVLGSQALKYLTPTRLR